MARMDEEAAAREIDKAAECTAHANELAVIADMLRQEARHHLREADELRGVHRTRSVNPAAARG